jgi:hypothetical protein
MLAHEIFHAKLYDTKNIPSEEHKQQRERKWKSKALPMWYVSTSAFSLPNITLVMLQAGVGTSK